jgi:hypothetical protein
MMGLKDTVMKLETLVSSMLELIATIHHVFHGIGITMLLLFLSEHYLEKVGIEMESDILRKLKIWYMTSQMLARSKEHQLLWLYQLQV